MRVLEIQCDLNLSDEAEAKLSEYIKAGMREGDALRQVAQDELGPTGAIVQIVDVVSY